MSTLRLIYGKGIPNPTKFIRTKWGQDPFSYGSYSYSLVGAKQPHDRLAIGATVADRVFFAGEATSVAHPATVHGAY